MRGICRGVVRGLHHSNALLVARIPRSPLATVFAPEDSAFGRRHMKPFGAALLAPAGGGIQ